LVNSPDMMRAAFVVRQLLTLCVLAWVAGYLALPVNAQPQAGERSAERIPQIGRVWRNGGGAPAARFVIETRGNANYLVRLYEKSGNRSVRGGNTVETKAPYGEYTLSLRYAVGGPDWFGLVGLFGPSTEVYEADATLRFYRSGNTIHGRSVTLYGVVGGNMATSKIDRGNF
jgi:hypothetical protein